MRTFSYLYSLVLSFSVLLIAFGVLTFLHVPVGTFGDWVAGLLSFFWLLTIVTVPWNIHFKAKAVLADAVATRERGMSVDDRQHNYVLRLAKTSLWAAIGLHVLSAAVLFILARIGIVRIGYVASVIALLLTALRPAASAYEYLAERLRTIGEGWRYPRQDVVELRDRLGLVESSVQEMKLQFDAERPESLISLERDHANEFRQQSAKLQADLELLRATNQNEHEQLSQQTRTAVSQLSADGQFLDHVREIIRFFKTA